jgi:flagellin
MALSILNNIPSLAAQNNLNITQSGLQKTLFRLSSGSRINTGADDAAGLAIADGLHANITALTQSARNANDGVGKLQVADGALSQVTALLDRAITLATEAATGTVSQSQREALNAEFTAIKAEIDRIGGKTTFNGTAVFVNASAPNLNEQDTPATAPSLSLSTPLTNGQSTTIASGPASFTFTAATGAGTNPNAAVSGGAALTAATALVSSKTLSVTRGGVTTTFATGAGTTNTVGDLINAINGQAVAGITTTGATTGLQASLVGGQVQTVDTAGNGNLAVTGFNIITGATSFNNAPATSTVQNLINAINADTTVGAKAVLSNGALKITDAQGRNNLAVSTTDTTLGAAVQGAPTTFTNPTTSGTTTDLNQLVGNATGLTSGTALSNGAVTAFTAGGKSFTFTAGPTSTLGDLLAAINNPADPAGLQAYIGSSGTTAGKLVVVDPGKNSNLAIAGTTTETVFGTAGNPLTTGTGTTDIFLSDSTAGGASTISVSVPGLGSATLDHGASHVSIAGDALLGADDAASIANAKKALTDVNQAVANIAAIRGDLGAGINRLQSAVNVINNQNQNLTAAEDGIRSADIAQEVANLTKYSILNQTGISALAQANQTQQQVLALLR